MDEKHGGKARLMYVGGMDQVVIRAVLCKVTSKSV